MVKLNYLLGVIVTPFKNFFIFEKWRWNYCNSLGIYEYRFQMITFYGFIIYLLIATMFEL